MICMNNDHNKKFGLLKFDSGYGKFNLNSPKGYSLKRIKAQTGLVCSLLLPVYPIFRVFGAGKGYLETQQFF